jgi:hypothetical protein
MALEDLYTSIPGLLHHMYLFYEVEPLIPIKAFCLSDFEERRQVQYYMLVKVPLVLSQH